MKRRELIKGLGALGILSILPGVTLGTLNCKNKRFHFVGLGTGGANIVNHIKEKGIDGKYSCINWFPSFTEPYPGLEHIDYEYPREFRYSTDLGRKKISLTPEMKTLLSGDCIYIVFVGLGSFTGTSLITYVIEHLENQNSNYLSICSTPFINEGRWRKEYARIKTSELIHFKRVQFFDNNYIQFKYKETRIVKCFELANEEMFSIFEKEFSNLIS